MMQNFLTSNQTADDLCWPLWVNKRMQPSSKLGYRIKSKYEMTNQSKKKKTLFCLLSTMQAHPITYKWFISLTSSHISSHFYKEINSSTPIKSETIPFSNSFEFGYKANHIENFNLFKKNTISNQRAVFSDSRTSSKFKVLFWLLAQIKAIYSPVWPWNFKAGGARWKQSLRILKLTKILFFRHSIARKCGC